MVGCTLYKAITASLPVRTRAWGLDERGDRHLGSIRSLIKRAVEVLIDELRGN
jgi:hypothetical protein